MIVFPAIIILAVFVFISSRQSSAVVDFFGWSVVYVTCFKQCQIACISLLNPVSLGCKLRQKSKFTTKSQLNNECPIDQAPVVQKLDSAIHRINYYPVDKYLGNQ